MRLYAFASCFCAVGAVDPGAARLWPGEAPGEHAGAIGPEGYERPDILTNVTIPTITPYLVANADSAVVIAPGGAYQVLSMEDEGKDIAAWLNSIGVSAFLLKYRVPQRTWLPFGAAPLMDAQRAVGMVREMATSGGVKGLNASKIGFMGFSAGGHLTGHLNVANQNRTYPRVDKADDESCRPDFSMMVYPWRSVTQAPVSEPISGASAANVTKDTPPTMLVQAEDDPVHPENALFYWQALHQQNVHAELHLYPRGGHGYGRCRGRCPGATCYEVCSWPDRGELFLKTLGIGADAETRTPSINETLLEYGYSDYMSDGEH